MGITLDPYMVKTDTQLPQLHQGLLDQVNLAGKSKGWYEAAAGKEFMKYVMYICSHM